MPTVYLGLGTNIEPREERLKQAVEALRSLEQAIHASSVYETAPVGIKEQPNFLNAVVSFHTDLDAQELLRSLRKMEESLGRKARKRWYEREIDFDMLFYGREIIEENNLSVPHPEMAKRKFVLVPLAEISPNFVHPVLGRTISELLQELMDDSQTIRKISLKL